MKKSNYGTFKVVKEKWEEKPPEHYGKKKLNWLLDQGKYWKENPPNTNEQMIQYVEYKTQSVTYNTKTWLSM